jgi:hypothetical protein
MHYINVIPLVLKTVHLQYKYKITRNVTVLYLGHQTNTHYITRHHCSHLSVDTVVPNRFGGVMVSMLISSPVDRVLVGSSKE